MNRGKDLYLLNKSEATPQIIRKLKPMNRPSTPPQSATRDSKGKASTSVSILTVLEVRIMERLVVFGIGT